MQGIFGGQRSYFKGTNSKETLCIQYALFFNLNDTFG